MWTRSKARKANQPVFIDNHWNDKYIQTKDEQIALLQSNNVLQDWNDDVDDDASCDSDSDSEGNCAHTSPQQVTFSKPSSSLKKNKRVMKRMTNELKACISYWLWNIMVVTVIPFFCHYIIQHHMRKDKRHVWPFNNCTLIGTMCTLLSNVSIIISLVLVTCHVFCLVPELFSKHSFISYKSLSEVTRMAKMQDVHYYSKCIQSFLLNQSLPRTLQDVVNGSASYSSEQMIFVSQCLILLSGALIILMSYHKLIRGLAALIVPIWIVITTYDSHVHKIHTSAIIHAIDPVVAFKNEAIIIDIDGNNLEEKGLIHWLPYWNPHENELETDSSPLTSILADGSVLVTFNSVNEYFPCYQSATLANRREQLGEREPPNNGTSQSVCFELLRVRVKDIRSIPGWSLDDKRASIISAATDGLE